MAAKLASSMKDFHHKPDISRAQIDALFAKHDFSLSRSITHLESNCTNQVFMVETHPKVKVHGGNVLLWGEAGLHNVLVENGSSLRISNVHDFQSAGWGTAIYDLQQAEGEYIAKPSSEHFETGYIDAFRSSYQTIIGEPPTESSAVEEKVLSIIKNLRQVRFFWDCGRLLHPKTPEYVGAAIADLESLHGYTG